MNPIITYSEQLPEITDYFPLFETTRWNNSYRATPAEIEKAISKSTYTISAYDDKKLVGFGRVVSDGILYAVIFDVIVLPEYQNRGIGREIVKRLVNFCLSKNIRDIQLFCAVGKVPFYKHLGFVERPGDAPGMKYKGP